jgi:predicted phosphodiesterase
MNNTERNKVIVFVVDDQLQINDPNSRLETYQECWSLLSSSLGKHWLFDVHYCTKPTDVFTVHVEPGQPVLAVVDMVLDNNPWTTDLIQQLDDWLFNNRVPILLVSQHFHQSDALERANRLTTRFAKHQIPFQFMLWQTIAASVKDKVLAEQCAFPIGSMLAIANARDLRFSKIEDEGISILHITDPHFGLAKWDAGALSVLRGRYRDLKLDKADFVAITGDVTNQGIPTEYACAVEYLNALAHNHLIFSGTSGVSVDRIFLVPGNHDYVRTIALSANIVSLEKNTFELVSDVQPNTDWIQNLARHPYRKFECDVAGRESPWTPNPGYRIDARYISAGVLFLEMDVEKNAVQGYQIGSHDDEIRKRLNEAGIAIGKIRKPGECVVVLAHRNEDNAWVALGSMFRNFFAGLATDGPVVFFCGHEHDAKIVSEYTKRVLLVRGIPSVEGPKLPAGQLPKLHYVSLGRKFGKVVSAAVHTFHQTPGEWLTNGKSSTFNWDDAEGWR